jgi:hypothetical protein
MAVHHQDQQVIANAVPPSLGGVEQASEFAHRQEVLAPLVQVGGCSMITRQPTLYISPAG